MVGVSVVFSTFNRAQSLPRLLDQLEQLEAPPGGWELVAVDNASTDGTGALLRERASRLPLTALFEPRQGKNHALNRALERAAGDLIVFTDDDVVLPPDWLAAYWRLAQERPDYGVFGGAIYPIWPKEPADWLLACAPKGFFGWTDFPEGPADPLTIWGPNMAVRRAALRGQRHLESLGPDGSDAYPTGSETELMLRLARLGVRCWHARGIAVGHVVRAEQLTPAWIVRRSFNQARGERHMEHRLGGEAAPIFNRRAATKADLFRARAFALAAKWLGDHEDRFRADLRVGTIEGDRAELHDLQLRAAEPSRRSAEVAGEARRLSRFLKAHGAERRAHYRGTLHDHLIRTHGLLRRAGARPAVCLGGGLHSVYGTNLLDFATVDLAHRHEVRRRFGADAELLAYLFAVLDRPRTLEAPAALEDDAAVVELSDGRELSLARAVFDDLRRVECANLADQGFLDRHAALKSFWTLDARESIGGPQPGEMR